MKPRIAHVINSFGLGGVPQVAYQLLRSLPADTYELYLYILKNYQDNSSARQLLIENFDKLGVTIRSPERDEKKFYVVSQLARWLIDDRIDILHTHSYKPNIYGRLAGSLCRSNHSIKMVAHYHNVYDDKWRKDDSLIYEQGLEPVTDCFLACSTSIARKNAEAIGLKNRQFEVILNGIDLDRFNESHDIASAKASFNMPLGFKIIGTVGRISTQKAQDIFLQAAALVLQQFSNCLFLIVGAPEEPGQLDALLALAASLGIQDKVIFLGHVNDIPKLYSILDVLAMPSRWEGLPLTLVEAMAIGLPIVTTAVGGISEVVTPDETALIVQPDNPRQLADAISRLLTDPDLCAIMKQSGRNRAQAFSHVTIGQQAHRLYQKLLDEKN